MGMSLKKEIAIAVLGLVGIGLLWVGWHAFEGLTEESGGPMVCTQEAKVCPDGSAVGRTGPHCEFAECPMGATGVVMARLNESAPADGILIQVLEVMEDSRCPAEVECFWMGTVKLRVQLSNGMSMSEHIFEVGTTIAIDTKEITLAHVSPQPRAGEKIAPHSYQFLFEIEQSTPEPMSE